MHVGKGGSCHARGERGGVELVVRMKDQRDIEGALGGRSGMLSVQHQQEVGGVGKGVIGLDDRMSFADAVVGRDDHGNL